MKFLNRKLNNKGFTLIELLAVIVILALVMVVALPNVLNSIDNARTKTLQNSVNAIADWAEKQYSIATLGSDFSTGGALDNAFTAVCTANQADINANREYCKGVTKPITNNFLTAAGAKPSNYLANSGTISINSRGRACVKLTSSGTGDFGNKKIKKCSSVCTSC